MAGRDDDHGRKFEVRFSPSLGRYMVATEDLGYHELVIDEAPLVIAPSGKFDWNRKFQRHYPVCIACLKSLGSESDHVKCPLCTWPLCQQDCPGSLQFHIADECNLFKSRGIIQTPRSLRMVYLIRCLILRATNPVKWSQLLDLTEVSTTSAPEEVTSGSDASSDAISGQDRQDHEYLSEVCGYQVSPELVAKLNGVKMVNGFGFCNNSETDEPRFYGVAVYFQVSMASHGCSPNLTTQVVYDPVEGFPMKFYTKCHVRKGEVLQIAYRDRWLTLGTLRRREKLFQDHKFWCQCSRCADPTENGTYFSAVTCTNCAPSDRSFLLPVNPLDCDSMWKCVNADCAVIKSEDEITGLLEIVTNETETALEAQVTERFQKLSGVFHGGCMRLLHPNNYLRVRAELEWIRHFPFHNLSVGECENEAWKSFVLIVERAQHCKDVYDKLIPDWSDRNNVIDLTMGRAIYLYYVQPERIFSLSNHLALDLMATALKHLQRGLQNEYNEDPASSDVFQMAKQLCSYVTSNYAQFSGSTQIVSNNKSDR